MSTLGLTVSLALLLLLSFISCSTRYLTASAISGRFGISELSAANTDEDLQWFHTVWGLNDPLDEQFLINIIADKLATEPQSFPHNKIIIAKYCLRKASTLTFPKSVAYPMALAEVSKILMESSEFAFLIDILATSDFKVPLIIAEGTNQMKDFIEFLSLSPEGHPFIDNLLDPKKSVLGSKQFIISAIIYNLPEHFYLNHLLSNPVGFLQLIPKILTESFKFDAEVKNRILEKVLRYFVQIKSLMMASPVTLNEFEHTIYSKFPLLVTSKFTDTFAHLGIDLPNLFPDQCITIFFLLKSLEKTDSVFFREVVAQIGKNFIPPIMDKLIKTLSRPIIESSELFEASQKFFDIYNILSEGQQESIKATTMFLSFLMNHFQVTQINLGDSVGGRFFATFKPTEKLIQAGCPPDFTNEIFAAVKGFASRNLIESYIQKITFADCEAVEQVLSEIWRLISEGAFAGGNFLIKFIKFETLNLISKSPKSLELISKIGLKVQEFGHDLIRILEIENVLHLSSLFTSLQLNSLKSLKFPSFNHFQLLETLTNTSIEVILLENVFSPSKRQVSFDEYIQTRNAFIYWSLKSDSSASRMKEITQPFLQYILSKEIPYCYNLFGNNEILSRAA